MAKLCCYPMCNSDSRRPEKHPGVQFIPFPKPKRHLEDCKIWIRACCRPYSHLNPSKINKDSYVCSRHFRDPSGPTEEYPYPIPFDRCVAKRVRKKPITDINPRKIKMHPFVKCAHNPATAKVQKMKHTCHADIWKSVTELSSEAKDNWVFYDKGNLVVAEQHQENGIVPRLRLEFDEDVNLRNLYLFGWNVPLSTLAVNYLKCRHLSTFLTYVNSIRICEGMSKKLIKWNVHPINMLKDNKIVTKEIIRSPDCVIIAGSNKDICSMRCNRCIYYEKWAVSQLRIDKAGFDEGIFQLQCNKVDGRFCSAIGCDRQVSKKEVRSDSDGSSDEESFEKRRCPRHFFKFPKNPTMKNRWIESMQRHDWIPSPADRLCSDHFSEVNIMRSANRIQLEPNAIPTRFKSLLKADRLCSAYGCNKIWKGKSSVRSDSEGSSDEESAEKRKYPRTFHRFPNDPYLKRLWLVNIRRKDWIHTDDAVICSDHFQEKDLFRNQQIAVLRPTALPTRSKACGNHINVKNRDPYALPTNEFTPLPWPSKEDEGTQTTDQENTLVEKLPATHFPATLDNLPTALENIKPPAKSETAVAAKIEACRRTVCLRSIVHDHSYASPIRPKTMRIKFRAQKRQIQTLQNTSSYVNQKYRRLRIRFDSLREMYERKRHRRLKS